MEELESKCYDKFDFKLEDLQILIAKAGNGDWVCTKFCVIDSVSRPVKTAIARMLIAYMPDRQGEFVQQPTTSDMLGHTSTDETI